MSYEEMTREQLIEKIMELEDENKILKYQSDHFKDMEEIFRYNEERFQIALKNTPTLVALMDKELKYTWIYNKPDFLTYDEIIEKRDDEIIRNPSGMKLLRIKENVLNNGSGIREEIKIHLKNRVITYDAFFEPIRDLSGKIVGLSLAATDISERKQLEEQIIKQNEELIMKNELIEKATEFSKIMIVHINLDGQIFKVPYNFSQMLGYTADELYGMNIYDLTHPEDRTRNIESLERLIKGEYQSYSFEKRYFRKNGEVVWVYVNRVLVRDLNGEPKYFIAYVKNITERKQLEEHLRQSYEELRISRERFQRAEEASNVMICSTDMEGNLIKIVPKFCELLGYSTEELLYRNIKDIVHPGDWKEAYFYGKSLRNNEIDSFAIEQRLIRKNGDIVWINLNCSRLEDEEGHFISVLAYIYDITKAKLDEEGLKEANKQLKAYIKKNEELMIQLRGFRHNALNVLHGLSGFIQSRDYTGLEKYFNEILVQSKELLDKNLFAVECIKNIALRGLLMVKLNDAKKLGINFRIVVQDNVSTNEYAIKDMDLCQVLGIYLDNAIEAAVHANIKKVTFYMFENEESNSIIIENTFKVRPNLVEINQGISTKGKDRGIGLRLSQKLLSRYPNILHNMFIQQQLFVQEIQMFKKKV